MSSPLIYQDCLVCEKLMPGLSYLKVKDVIDELWMIEYEAILDAFSERSANDAHIYQLRT